MLEEMEVEWKEWVAKVREAYESGKVVEEEESNTTTRVVGEAEVRWIEMSTMGGDETDNDLVVEGDGVMAVPNGGRKVVGGGKQGCSDSSSSSCWGPSSWMVDISRTNATIIFSLFDICHFISFLVYTFCLGLCSAISFLFFDLVIGRDLGASPNEPTMVLLFVSLLISSSSSPYVSFVPCPFN